MAISKDQLISDLAEAIDSPKAKIRALLEQLSEIVTDALENNDEITLPGIGKLKITQRPARTGRNPQTGNAIDIAAKNVVKFVPAKALTDAIN
jgi:DNA-binding protein HU-beta